jgi:hypothetical protein
VAVSTSASLAADPLFGEWDTGPYSTDEYAGHTKWEVHVSFYEEGGVPFVLMTGWDPTNGPMPDGGDHGPYKLLPNGQIAIASADQPQFSTVYSYQLDGNELILSWLHNDPNGPDASDVSGPFTTIRLIRR